MALLPEVVNLTPSRKKLLEQLHDGRWHHKFPGIGIRTFDLMSILDFIDVKFSSKNPDKTNNWKVKARITQKGRFLLKNKKATIVYGRDVAIREMGV